MFVFRLFISLAALAFAVPAHAQDQSSAAPAALNTDERVEIVTDQEQGAVRILIDGKPVVIIDETGLHVRESIHYGSTSVDYGPSGFEAHAAQSKAERHEP